MGIVDILKSKGISPRTDIADALNASKDPMYPGQQSNLYAPQFEHAATWAETNLTDEKVVLMGWASQGSRFLGGPILGMLVVTESKFCFVRKEPGGNCVEIVHELSKIHNHSTSGFLALRSIQYSIDGEDYKLGLRLQ
mmetsp:Transcript_21686/g.32910  ORF Transcript_21686/g.32910 Transcript_21686/m.32910 type:complete len:138 (-) Transcript_21686:107-520(-)|eukprot:CAMPEP_0194208508 /NCGR_PEP_ID=MMETSP0156-20130528/6937_1 /TAXON_ID=33649 /ORGANISM="Thalassionema nitzschioides, Strain L26-B" /LENGTH=137 /DNA_ID=CAMNT_0038935481 /DNA_START=38 /DNA_END=451 /DNA_ORIENTATION=+